MSRLVIFDSFKMIKEKREEEAAWTKLKAYFPDKYVSLDHDRERFESGTEKIRYHAYVSLGIKTFLGGEFISPMEAVNNLIQKVEKEGDL